VLASHIAAATFSLGRGRIVRLDLAPKGLIPIESMRSQLRTVPGIAGIPATLDGTWTSRRRTQTLVLNPTTRPVHHILGPSHDDRAVELSPGDMVVVPASP
jgi:hypothetical protein